MQIDLAGIAAVLAVPASLVVGLLTARRSRGLEDRIERIMDILDRMPRRSAERDALLDARDELAYRLAMRTFNTIPLGTLFGIWGVGIGYVAAGSLWRAVAPDDDSPLRLFIIWVGLVIVLFALLLSGLTVHVRSRRARRNEVLRKKAAAYYEQSAFDRWKQDRRERREGRLDEARTAEDPTAGARRPRRLSRAVPR
jgi:hypothetical protein